MGSHVGPGTVPDTYNHSYLNESPGCLFVGLRTEAQDFFFKSRSPNPSRLTPVELENQAS